MTPGGSAQTRLTGAPQYEPDYSPDGRQMVFMGYRYRGGFYRPQIYRSTGRGPTGPALHGSPTPKM